MPGKFLIFVILALLSFPTFADDSLKGLSGQSYSIAELLQIVADKPEKTDYQAAVIEVNLRNGSRYSGIVLSYAPKKGVCTIRHSDGTHTIVDLGSILSVTVIDPGSARTELQGNKIYLSKSDEVSTKLSVRRMLADISGRYGTKISLSIDESMLDDRACRFFTDKVINALGESLAKVTTDSMGRDALGAVSEGIDVLHKAGGEILVEKVGKKITLSFDCKGPLDADYSKRIFTYVNDLLVD
ncbi:MAG TPA: hypothetical protein PKA63_01285 [Oligoflexia bacterium]|nr:hypothetical protein [Oligoflexia bacterium]HMP47282.1 hypothetical protein [Oligoflexia bacterium]